MGPSDGKPQRTGLRRWLWPRRGRWRWAVVRLVVAGALLVVFRLHVLTWLVAGHNFAWRVTTGSHRNHPNDVEYLLRLGDPGTRMLARLGEAGALSRSTALEALLGVARSSASPYVRAQALEGLSGIDDDRVLAAAAGALDDPDPSVRRAAVRALAALGDDRQRPLLEQRRAAETDPGVARLMSQAVEDLLPAPGPSQAPGGRVKVAAIQFRSEFGQPEANRARLEVLIREAARNGARIVSLPETAIPGYLSFDLRTAWQADGMAVSEGLRGVSPQGIGETVPGPSTEAFARLAGELGIYLSVPIVEIDQPTGRYYNTLCLAGPDGRLLLHYRKLNPWLYAERGWAARGDLGRPWVDTPYGRLSLLVCYDIHSEPRHLKAAGVDILLYSICWVDRERSPWFRAELPRLARESNLHIIGANWTVPRKSPWHGYGHSLIIERTGRVLARASRNIGEEIVYAELPVAPRP